MASTTMRGAVGIVRRMGVGLAVLGLSLALVGSSAVAQEAPSFVVQDSGVIPFGRLPEDAVGV